MDKKEKVSSLGVEKIAVFKRAWCKHQASQLARHKVEAQKKARRLPTQEKPFRSPQCLREFVLCSNGFVFLRWRRGPRK